MDSNVVEGAITVMENLKLPFDRIRARAEYPTLIEALRKKANVGEILKAAALEARDTGLLAGFSREQIDKDLLEFRPLLQAQALKVYQMRRQDIAKQVVGNAGMTINIVNYRSEMNMLAGKAGLTTERVDADLKELAELQKIRWKSKGANN